jgi:hypothetical protein
MHNVCLTAMMLSVKAAKSRITEPVEIPNVAMAAAPRSGGSFCERCAENQFRTQRIAWPEISPSFLEHNASIQRCDGASRTPSVAYRVKGESGTGIPSPNCSGVGGLPILG